MAPNTFDMGDFNPRDLLPKDLMPKDLRQKVCDHMGVDPSTLTIVSEQFEKYNHPNLQLALNEISDNKDNHMDEAMHELLVVGGTLTKSLLGSSEIGFTPTGFKDS